MASLRESKKAATRSALARAAAGIALYDGAEGLTIPAITAAAGVSPRTFHNYFASREEAVIDFISERVEALVLDFSQLPDDMDLLSAVGEIASGLLRAGDPGLDSFPTLFRLGEVLDTIAPQRARCAAESVLDPMIAELGRRNRELTEFQLATMARLIAVATGAALERYYSLPEPRDPVEGERMLGEAIGLLRRV